MDLAFICDRSAAQQLVIAVEDRGMDSAPCQG
jgi:hypothetical protein